MERRVVGGRKRARRYGTDASAGRASRTLRNWTLRSAFWAASDSMRDSCSGG